MKILVLIPARLESTRLPKKALLKINNTPMIIKLINRVKTVKNSEILVCTTNLKSDEKLVKIDGQLLVERLPPKDTIVKIKPSSYYMYNREKFVNFINTIFNNCYFI